MSSFISMGGSLKAHIPHCPCPAEPKQMPEALSNLLGPNSTDHMVKSRGNHYEEICQLDVDMAGHCVVVKTVNQEGEEGRCVEQSHDTCMGPTGTQGLVTGTMGWQAINSMKNESIGNAYEPCSKG